MNTSEVLLDNNQLRISLEDGGEVSLSAQYAWQLVEHARDLLIESSERLKTPIVSSLSVNKRTFNVMVNKNLNFWKLLASGRWEPNTYSVFDRFVTADHVYLDIGAWIGPTVLYAAQLAKSAYAFEPDPIAYRELKINVELNSDQAWARKLMIFNKAVTRDTQNLRIGNRGNGGDSTSSALFSHENTAWEVEGTRLQDLITSHGLEKEKLFIKIDIEGGEYDLIPSIAGLLGSHDTTLLLSLHPDFLKQYLDKSSKSNFLARSWQRLIFFRKHLGLVRSLPFRHIYTSDGKKLYPLRELIRAFCKGSFAKEIVATNSTWN